MPDAWSKKDERQYQHVKDSMKEQGKNEKQAKSIAAQTVNKQRREESRTPNKTTQGSGNPNRSLDQRTRQELYNRATELNIKGRSKMNKSELVTAIRERQS